MTQLTQCLSFDLANPLTSDVEFFAHFFQRAATPIVQTKAQLEHLALTLGQAVQHILDLLFEQLMAGGFSWSERGVIFEEVTEMAVLFFTDRRLQAHWLLAHFD